MDKYERLTMIVILGIVAVCGLYLGKIEVVTGAIGIIGGVLVPKKD